MASRLAGAVLALSAAALLAVSVLVAPWWNGHPTYAGAMIKAKEISIGPLGATGCNTGGDGACMSVPVDATFETIGFALAGVATLLALVTAILAILALRGAGVRKTFAVFAIVGALIAGGLAAVLVVVGPQVRTEAPIPLGIGLYVFAGGVAAAFAGAFVAFRIEDRPTRMQLAPARQSATALPPPAAPGGNVDVRALLAEDALRPSSLGPEPMLGKPAVQSPGGVLPGPSGPLGAVAGSGPQQPLFSSAPQLRPLYEMPGQGGPLPRPSPSIPLRAPTPIPRDQMRAIAGIPTPASVDVPAIAAASSTPPPAAGTNQETDRDLLGTARVPKAKTLPPPTRNKPVTAAPRSSGELRAAASALPAAPRAIAPIPPLVSGGPIARATPMPPKPAPKSAVPPLPAAGFPNVESEDGTFDAMKTYQREPAPRPATPRPPTRLLTEDSALDTDVSTQAIDDDAPATESFETATSESTSFAQKPQRPPTVSATMETQPAPEGEEGEGDDELMTRARDKVAATDMDLPAVRPPTETAQTAPDEAPTDHEKDKDKDKGKPPISTAPTSLPPPSEKQQASSGPSPACPQCEAPMAWVEAHLRFYCKSCKMYF